jgi:hypothetical protein
VFVQTNKFYFAIVYKFVSRGFSLLTFVVVLFVWKENKCKFAEETKMEEKETRGEETRTIRPDLPRPAWILFLVFGWRVVIFQPAGCGFGGRKCKHLPRSALCPPLDPAVGHLMLYKLYGALNNHELNLIDLIKRFKLTL